MERLPVIEAHLAATPAGPPVDARMRAIDGMAQVRVPAGTFRMGSAAEDPAAAEDEKPRRAVTLDGFWIDRTEVSNFQYRQCVAAGGCSPHRSQGSRFEGDYQPVVGVNWYQAARYCRWAGGRLPTEAEWEKAARGVDGRIYPWGNVFDGARLNWCDSNCIADWRNFDLNDGYRYTAPVGSYLLGASPYGALDMSGNVWEWTADWYQPQAYAQAAGNNPTGPAKGVQKVVRGGSWLYYGKNLRVTARHKDLPGYSYDNIGFRCVMEE
jgi:formylglycine-generating enzyme required for sulfatase activity